MAEEPITDLTQKPKKKWYKTWWGIIFLILVWPGTLIWLIWAKTKWKTFYKGLATGGIVLFFIIVLASMGGSSTNTNTQKNVSDTDKDPVITLTNPKGDATVQSGEIEVKGTLTPTISNLYINDEGIYYNNDGTFNKKISLKEGKNVIKIKATNSGKNKEITLNVTRELTDQEKAQQEAAKQAAEASRKRTSQEIFDQTQEGMSQQQILDIAKRQPDDKQVSQGYGFNTEYWYYKDSGLSHQVQIVFEDGVVKSKNLY
jgi:predicted DNA-binding antitoxin AbrB/MazE fold protein